MNDSKPTVIQLCTSGAFGGLEMSTIKMTRLFRQAGYNSICICRDGSQIHDTLIKEGLQAFPINPRDYFSPLSTLKIRKLLKAHPGAVIYFHLFRDLWILRPALIGTGKRRIFGFARMFFKNVNKKDWAHRQIYSCIEKVIALSSIQKSYLIDCLPLREDQYVVIPNGVDIERFSPGKPNQKIRQEWGVKDDEILIGHVGRIDIQKGQIELIQAMKSICETHPKTKLAVVGNAWTQEFFDEVKSIPKSLGIEDKVIIPGRRNDTPEVLRAFDIFVMPSYEENFGNVLLEAMAAGLPSIGTNTGGTPDMIDDGENGLLVDAKSSESLATAINRLVDSPELRKRLGMAARRKAESVYSMDHVFSQIKGLI